MKNDASYVNKELGAEAIYDGEYDNECTWEVGPCLC